MHTGNRREMTYEVSSADDAGENDDADAGRSALSACDPTDIELGASILEAAVKSITDCSSSSPSRSKKSMSTSMSMSRQTTSTSTCGEGGGDMTGGLTGKIGPSLKTLEPEDRRRRPMT